MLWCFPAFLFRVWTHARKHTHTHTHTHTRTFLFFFSTLSTAIAQVEHDEYIKRRFNAGQPGAVDVAFVVDESSSMGDAHAWMNVMVDILEVEIRKQGIGLSASTPNLYGLVGFGRPTGSAPNGYLGHTFELNGKKLVPFPAFLEMLKLLQSFPNGRVEDGYQAMEHAMLDIPFRTAGNIERVMILITDEDRDRTPEGLHITRRDMYFILHRHRFFGLHVVVDSSFIANRTTPVLGIHTSGRDTFGYLLNQEGQVVKLPSGRERGGYQRTSYDYITLTRWAQGSAWNIEELRKFGSTGEEPALTAAFTQALAANIYEQGSQCFFCHTSSKGSTRCTVDSCQVGGKKASLTKVFVQVWIWFNIFRSLLKDAFCLASPASNTSGLLALTEPFTAFMKLARSQCAHSTYPSPFNVKCTTPPSCHACTCKCLWVPGHMPNTPARPGDPPPHPWWKVWRFCWTEICTSGTCMSTRTCESCKPPFENGW